MRLAIEQDRDLVRFVVRDEGSGIPFDVLRRAGEPFFTTKEAGRGFGLGLFLARVFAERCGARSHPAPIEGRPRPDVAALGAGIWTMTTADVDARTLLLIDDDSTLRTRLARAFGARGLLVTTASTFDEAIARAKDDPPELALVDLRVCLEGLASTSFASCARQTRRRPSSCSLATACIATAVESMRSGATTYLTKPVDADQILAAFNRAEATAQAQPTIAVPSLARVEWEHIQRVLVECGGNLSQAARLPGDSPTIVAAQTREGPWPGNATGMNGSGHGPVSRRRRRGYDPSSSRDVSPTPFLLMGLTFQTAAPCSDVNTSRARRRSHRTSGAGIAACLAALTLLLLSARPVSAHDLIQEQVVQVTMRVDAGALRRPPAVSGVCALLTRPAAHR